MIWQPYPHSRQAIPANLKSWLLDRGSLTDRLVQASRGQFRVQVLRQHWGTCHSDESRALGTAPRHRVLIREVILQGNHQPWVYARSILPNSSLEHSLRYLKRIGSKPLGAVLFSDPHLRRGEIEIARLQPGQLPIAVNQSVWGRRSVFYLHRQPLLVSEIFLPEFVAQLS
jgi:chorismate--pyruvate lyase